jgi:hypothetical protein
METKLGEMPESVKVNAELVRLLESMLTDAKAGRVVAGGVVAVIGPSQFMAFGAMSSFPAEVIAGAAVLTSDTILRMRQPRVPSIVRAGAMPLMNG